MFTHTTILYFQPLSKNKGLFITPDNVRSLATFLHSSASISDRIIHFGSGSRLHEELLRVPLAGQGELDPHSTIRVTVGLKPHSPPVDSDNEIAITDGTNSNQLFIHDTNNYPNTACYLTDGTHENVRVPSGTPQASQYVLLFEPFHGYGSCSSAQLGGYVNLGHFNKQVDVSKGLSLVVNRNHAAETYNYYYFMVEIISQNI